MVGGSRPGGCGERTRHDDGSHAGPNQAEEREEVACSAR